MKKLPHLLIAFRLVLGPVMIGITYILTEAGRPLLVMLLLLGLLSDIFDGIIARYHQVSTATLRRMDSQTDLVFWLCAGWCTWMLDPEIISANCYLIILMLLMESLTYVLSIAKFGKETCTHALLSKLWGLSLFVGFTSLIGFGYGGLPLKLAFTLGIISHIDIYLIIIFLPKWTHDVPSAWHAWQIRQGREIRRRRLFNG